MRIRALILGAIAITFSTPAFAGGRDATEERPGVRRAATILMSDDPEDLTQHAHPLDSFAVAPWLVENVHLDKRGFKYVRRFGELGEDRVVIKFRGPLMKKRRFGLTIDVRF